MLKILILLLTTIIICQSQEMLIEKISMDIQQVIVTSNNNIFLFGDYGDLKISTNLGKNWLYQKLDTKATLSKTFVFGDTVVVIYSNGDIYKSYLDVEKWERNKFQNVDSILFVDFDNNNYFVFDKQYVIKYNQNLKLINSIGHNLSTKIDNLEKKDVYKYSKYRFTTINDTSYILIDSSRIFTFDFKKFSTGLIDTRPYDDCIRCDTCKPCREITSLYKYNNQLLINKKSRLNIFNNNKYKQILPDTNLVYTKIIENNFANVALGLNLKTLAFDSYFCQIADLNNLEINNLKLFNNDFNTGNLSFNDYYFKDSLFILVGNNNVILLTSNNGIKWDIISDISGASFNISPIIRQDSTTILFSQYKSELVYGINNKLYYSKDNLNTIHAFAVDDVNNLPFQKLEYGANVLQKLSNNNYLIAGATQLFYNNINYKYLTTSDEFKTFIPDSFKGEEYFKFVMRGNESFTIYHTNQFFESIDYYATITSFWNDFTGYKKDYIQVMYFDKDFSGFKKFYDSLVILDYGLILDTTSLIYFGRSSIDFEKSQNIIQITNNTGLKWDTLYRFSSNYRMKNFYSLSKDSLIFLLVDSTETSLYLFTLNNKKLLKLFNAKVKTDNLNFVIWDSKYYLLGSPNSYFSEENNLSEWKVYKFPNNGKILNNPFDYNKSLVAEYMDDNYKRGIYKISPKSLNSIKTESERVYLYAAKPYPIPAVGSVKTLIYWNSAYNIDEAELGLYDIFGAKLNVPNITIQKIEAYSGNLVVDCSILPSGIYFARLNLGMENISIPIVVGK